MQCACVTLCREVQRTAYIFPGGHWIRANIQCGHRKVVCLFKQETPEGVRWPLWKRSRNPITRHRNIASQPDSQLHKKAPSHNSIAFVGGPPRPYRPIIHGTMSSVALREKNQSNVLTCANRGFTHHEYLQINGRLW